MTTRTAAPSPAPPSHPRAAAIARSVAALGAGGLFYLSFPPRSLWILAPIGFAVLTLVLRGRRVRAGFGYGFLAGVGLFVPLLPWVGAYVGPVPWLALAAAQALAVGLFGALAVLVARLPLAPLWVACAWVATEAIRARVPFGGFPWGRLAFGQADGPLLALARIGGAPGLSFAVALSGAAVAGLLTSLARRRFRRGLLFGACALTPVAAAVALPDTGSTPRQNATVAVVQGNVPRLGLDFNAQRRAVLDNHVAQTEKLAADVAAGASPQPEMVIWPENASDIDPLRNRDAAAAIDRAARSIGVPILVGAVLVNDDGTTRNTSIVWDPRTGPGQSHDKRQLVPFGEYLPMRSAVTALVPSADEAGHFVAGDGDGTVTLNGFPLSVATCYEVAFDDLVAESIRAGTSLITVPTNNATFGDTDMTYQQLAMSRVRAVEHDRSVAVAATSGVSAIITPDGTIQSQTEIFTADALVERVPLRENITPATRAGAAPELAASITGVAAAFGAARLRRRRAERPDQAIY
ncbi:apolipoprotein N-acyltransferase [Tomitella fengzijianii]|uniref:Apolipoprotein N-acyltransferase n=1 Tax=Tomitella fengzijianii TaxID=2597660 RepID=A0A516X8K7_9ACTN|nr:apolipoprotein N-acyltransferase [Tomitella fengzijianii]